MNREAESRFAIFPQLEKPRSIFDRSHQVKTTFNVGDLVPVEVWQDVMPGDTIKMNTSVLTRITSALKFPPIDNAYLDYFYFFVPNRLLYEDWEKLMGENDDPWAQQTIYTIPQIRTPAEGYAKGTIGNQLGIPKRAKNVEISSLPFKAYAKIFNDFFRNQNTQYCCDIDKTGTTLTGVNTGNYVTDVQLGGKCAKVNKFHDYFTSCLPEPQKHADVLLPLGTSAPILNNTDTTNKFSPIWYDGAGNVLDNYQRLLAKKFDNGKGTTMGPTTDQGYGAGAYTALKADLSQATAATMNQFYQAMALQRMYNIDALGGTRYNELIYAHYGVKSPDARLERAEYLGGKRIAINTQQVEQTSESTETGKLASLGAYSQTGSYDETFTYSAQEFGILMCLVCVRTEHSYQQGIERAWFRKYREDHYFPSLANIGEMAVLNREIFVKGDSSDEEVFGYQEAWADYRYKPSRVAGQLKSDEEGSLDIMTYADNYQDTPTLSPEWGEEPLENMDRTLATSHEVADQILIDCYFEETWTREMPMFSIPGIPA